MRQISALGTMMLLGFILLTAWFGQKLLMQQTPDAIRGGSLSVLAAMLFVLLNAWIHQPQSVSKKQKGCVQRARAILSQEPLGTALLFLGVVYGCATFWLHTRPDISPWVLLGVWFSSLGLLLVGTWRIDKRFLHVSHWATTSSNALSINRWEWLALFTLTSAAFLLRAVFLGNLPHNLSGDEAEMGMTARMVLSGAVHDPFAAGWLSHPNLWFFFQALSLRLFGDNVGGLRMASVLFGTATIPALFLFARRLYGKTPALIATALLATSHFHIHYSRNALNNIADPLFGIIGFTALYRGIQKRSLFSFTLTGVALGLAQHFYMGARLLPLLLLVVLLHQFLLRPISLIRLRWHLVFLLVGFLIAFGPLMVFFASRPDVFNARITMVGIFHSEWFISQQRLGRSISAILLEQLRGGFGAFTFVADRSAQYDPGVALLDPFASILFLFGVALLITRWRQFNSVIILAWLGGTALLGGVLLASAPVSPRYVTTAPLMCLVVALALDQMRHILHSLNGIPKHITNGLALAVVAFLAFWNINFYFNIYTPRNVFGWINVEVGTEVGIYLSKQTDPVYVYFFGPPRMYYGFGSIRFLAPEVQGTDMLEPLMRPNQLPPHPDGYRPVFVFLPEREAELAVIRQRYPNGELYRVPRITSDEVLFVSYVPDRE
jgi:hypothetical protein